MLCRRELERSRARPQHKHKLTLAAAQDMVVESQLETLWAQHDKAKRGKIDKRAFVSRTSPRATLHDFSCPTLAPPRAR